MNKSKPKLFILFLLFSPFFVILSEAKDLTLYSHYDYSQRTIHDDDDEIINNTSYKSNNYNLRMTHSPTSQFTYQITAHQEDNDYTEQNDKDKQSQRLELNLDYMTKNKLHLFNFKTRTKTNRTINSPRDDYNNTRFALTHQFEKPKNYRIKTNLIMNEFEYPTAQNKNIITTAGKIEYLKYFNDENLETGFDYKLEHADRKVINKLQTKNEYKITINNNFKSRYIKNAKAYYKYSEQDTKDDELLDIDTDYKTDEYRLSTRHDLTDKFDTNFNFEYMTKKYFELENNYKRRAIDNVLKYELSNTKEARTWFNLKTEYKKIDYND